MTEDHRTPADFLPEALDLRKRRARKVEADMQRFKRQVPDDLEVGNADASPRTLAFVLAAMAAFDRRADESRCCEHARAAMDMPTDRRMAEAPLVRIMLRTGHASCRACADVVLPTCDERPGEWACDICDAEGRDLSVIDFLFGHWHAHAHVCASCAAFYEPSRNGHGRARWEDALDLQVHLLDLARHRRLLMADLHLDVPVEDEASDRFADYLMRAEPVYLAEDVFDAWEFARAAFEPEAIHDDEPFTPAGLVLFPRPLTIVGTTLPAHAVLWALDADKLQIVKFGRRNTEWRITGGALLPLGHHPNDVRFDGIVRPGTRRIDDSERELPFRQWAAMQSLWRMARGFVRVPERASRPGRRAAKRANIDHDHVTVIRLRRQRHENPEAERHVDWSCRWMVRGHWRHLHDGRQAWVMPYVKGPDDKPFRITDRVWEFVR